MDYSKEELRAVIVTVLRQKFPNVWEKLIESIADEIIESLKDKK